MINGAATADICTVTNNRAEYPAPCPDSNIVTDNGAFNNSTFINRTVAAYAVFTVRKHLLVCTEQVSRSTQVGKAALFGISVYPYAAFQHSRKSVPENILAIVGNMSRKTCVYNKAARQYHIGNTAFLRLTECNVL